METSLRKILLRGLITLFSILLIIILNSYLNYRLETMPEMNVMTGREGMEYEYHFTGMITAWKNYSPADVNQDNDLIVRRSGKEEGIESANEFPRQEKFR